MKSARGGPHVMFSLIDSILIKLSRTVDGDIRMSLPYQIIIKCLLNVLLHVLIKFLRNVDGEVHMSLSYRLVIHSLLIS